MTKKIKTLGDALPEEINRVRNLQNQYRRLGEFPSANVEPAIAIMEAAIQFGIKASMSGDINDILEAYQLLKDFEE